MASLSRENLQLGMLIGVILFGLGAYQEYGPVSGQTPTVQGKMGVYRADSGWGTLNLVPLDLFKVNNVVVGPNDVIFAQAWLNIQSDKPFKVKSVKWTLESWEGTSKLVMRRGTHDIYGGNTPLTTPETYVAVSDIFASNQPATIYLNYLDPRTPVDDLYSGKFGVGYVLQGSPTSVIVRTMHVWLPKELPWGTHTYRSVWTVESVVLELYDAAKTTKVGEQTLTGPWTWTGAFQTLCEQTTTATTTTATTTSQITASVTIVITGGTSVITTVSTGTSTTGVQTTGGQVATVLTINQGWDTTVSPQKMKFFGVLKTVSGQPVPSKLVTLAVEGASPGAVTSTDGSWTVTLGPAFYPDTATATFAGDSTYKPCSATWPAIPGAQLVPISVITIGGAAYRSTQLLMLLGASMVVACFLIYRRK